MVGAIGGSTSLLASVASSTQSAATDQNVAIAVMMKAQDVEKAQGEAALKLIDSASTSGSGRIDVYA